MESPPECQTSGRLRSTRVVPPWHFSSFGGPVRALLPKNRRNVPLSASGKHRGHAAPRTASPDGAAVLVLLGVVGFPMLFDTQPRPIPVDVPIEIPDRNKAAPLVVPANAGDADATKSVVASSDRSGQQSRTGTERLTASSTLADGEELVSSSSSGSNRAAVKPNPGSTAGAAASAGTKAPETKALQPTRPRR